MKYIKTALSFQGQAELLISRGLIVDNKQELENYLSRINYYRLSGYWYPFKKIDSFIGDESFKPGTTFQMIRDLYEFDRRLRLLFMNAIERIEVAIFRTQLVEINTNLYGPFGYTDQKNYNPKFIAYDLQKLLDDISEDEDRSKEEFITRYRTKYDEESYLPLWMAVELMSFGQLLTLYRNQRLAVKQALSHQYKLFPQVLDSWMLTLGALRNSCAHHNRLWNRPSPLVIRLPDQRNDSRWYIPEIIPDNRLYTVLIVIQCLLGFISPADQWKESIKSLLNAYPTIPLKPMGIPEKWQESPLWN
jgi:abortive infection bacteriophage resistance protein